MLTALVIGDPHFKVANVRETEEMSQKIVALAKERHPDFIVVLGDILDRHETIHVSPLERATMFLDELRQIAPLYAIIGNHDRPNNSNFLTSEHPFNALKVWPETIIVDKVLMMNIKGHQFIFVPYVPPGRFVEALETLDAHKGKLEDTLGKTTAIFAHQEFKGAKMGAVISQDGDDWKLNHPYVISGHIHDFDQPSPNIIYCGTPIQHAFGDRDDKTVSWFTWNTLLKGQPYIPEHQRIDLGLMKKVILHLTTTEVAKYVPESGKQIKIVVTGSTAEIKAATKLANIKSLIANGVKVVYKDTSICEIKGEGITTNQKYSERLYSAVSDDPELRKLYTRLFSDCQRKPKAAPLVIPKRNQG